MKSYNHLYERFISDENYYLAVRNATKHKGGKKRKWRYARYIRDNAEELKPKFIEYASNFKNAKHKPKIIYDGIRRKQRSILVPTMAEQIIHHMVVNILEPIFMRSMYEHSYGSLPNRGAHLAKKRIERWIRKDADNFRYILKLDVKKYFDSIPHDILKARLAKLIHDDRFLDLVYEIVDVSDKGIPIGFYTSQWIANWYLTGLDHYIKEVLRAKYYVRYMDDMVIAGNDKLLLHIIKDGIEKYLNEELGLELKSNWQIFPLDKRPLDFMGFKFYHGRTTLRKTILSKAKRKARRTKKNGVNIHSARQMLSYLGWIDKTDVYGFYLRYIKPKVSFKALRLYEGHWQRIHNQMEVKHHVKLV